MISNQVLQTTIDGLKNITRIDICVMDTEGKALATTINNVEEYEDDNGMNFAEFVAILSGNTDLLNKAKLDNKIKIGRASCRERV